jgi:hypothetical protein
MPAKQDLTGQIFGKLTVLKYAHSNKNSVSFYLCRCECGTEKVISGINLKRTTKSTKSCGCLHMDQLKNLRSDDPQLMAAKRLWNSNYTDGCSFEKFLELSQQPCFYCGLTNSNRYNSYTAKQAEIGRISQEWYEQCWFEYNGLDRIDSSKPHTEDNIVPCCVNCNIAKSDMTLEEFRVWLKRVYNNFIIKGNKCQE